MPPFGLNPRRGAVNGYDSSVTKTMRGVLKIVPVSGGIGVIADNSWRAMQAALAIEPDWGPAPYPAEMDDHWITLEDSFTRKHRDSRFRDDGDINAALTDADITTAEYRAPYLAHAPLEPVNTTVLASDTRLDIWTGTQIPRFVQKNATRIAGIDAQDVHVHVLMMGGSFGHRLEDDIVRLATELALAMKGAPVKLTYSREEDFSHNYPRQNAMARGRGAAKNGQVTGYDLGIVMPSVLSSQMSRQGLLELGPDTQIIAGVWDQPYDIPNYWTDRAIVPLQVLI